MDVDVAQTATAAMPYITAAVVTYGVSTLDKVRDGLIDRAADFTIGAGQRILGRLLGREESRQALEEAVADMAAGEEDSDAALRLQIRKILASDPEIAKDVAAILPSSSSYTTYIGSQSNTGSGTFIAGGNYGPINPPPREVR